MSSDLLGTAAADGVLTFVNPAWAALVGRGEDELVGTAFLDLVHPEDHAAAAAILEGDDIRDVPCRILTADGDRFVRWNACLDDGCLHLAGRDVTEDQRMADELQDFAYVASHDLAEPLRMVTAYLDLLQRRYADQLDPTAHEFIGYAVGGAERMQAMIEGLLTYSRVGTHEMAPADFALRDVLGAAPGVEIAEPSATIHGDPTQIAQLLHQLIGNAVRFQSPDRPLQVTVSAGEQDGGVRIDVGDNGIGIPDGQRERIFKMFTRLHGRDEYEGTGIGLSVCRRIAERHAGHISVASTEDVGSVFSVWLPS